eukprot:80829-Hanusia_phi.AAC.3
MEVPCHKVWEERAGGRGQGAGPVRGGYVRRGAEMREDTRGERRRVRWAQCDGWEEEEATDERMTRRRRDSASWHVALTSATTTALIHDDEIPCAPRTPSPTFRARTGQSAMQLSPSWWHQRQGIDDSRTSPASA